MVIIKREDLKKLVAWRYVMKKTFKIKKTPSLSFESYVNAKYKWLVCCLKKCKKAVP